MRAGVLAVSSREDGKIYLFKAVGGRAPFHVIDSMHTQYVTLIKYNSKFNTVCSVLCAWGVGGVAYVFSMHV